MDFSNKAWTSSFGLPYGRQASAKSLSSNVGLAKISGAKQSSTTSKINHALEVLKKYDNKYRIKSGGIEVSHTEVDDSNSSRALSSKSDKSENVEKDVGLGLFDTEIDELDTKVSLKNDSDDLPSKSRPRAKPQTVDLLIKPPKFTGALDKIVGLKQSAAQAKTENEDYESDFESSDSDSLSGDSVYDIDDNLRIESNVRPTDVERQHVNVSESEVESSSIHTVIDHNIKPSSVENVGLFGDIKVFAFSDLGSEKQVNQYNLSDHIDNSPTSPTLPKSKPKSDMNYLNRKTKGERPLDASYPGFSESQSNLKHSGNENKISHVEAISERSLSDKSISEQLSKQDDSGGSTPPHLHNFLTLDELEDNISDQSKDIPAPTQTSKPLDVKGIKSRLASNEVEYKGPSNLLTSAGSEEEIEEQLDGSNDIKEERDEYTSSNLSHDSDYLKSEKSYKESSSNSESSKISEESKNSVESVNLSDGRDGENHESNNVRSKATQEQLLPADTATKETSDLKKQKRTRNIGAQTYSYGYERQSSQSKSRHKERHARPTPSPPVIQPLKMSWTFEEAESSKSAIVFQDLALSPEVIEVLAKNTVAEDALNQIMQQQISLTKHFMASQYKMYQTYYATVKQLTDQYRPITLQDTKEFIRRNRKMRPHVLDEEVY